MSELLRCPFCGGEAETVHTRSGDDFVRCVDKSCHARTRNYHEAEKLAIDAWNTRATPEIEVCENANTDGYEYRFECSKCGHSVIVHDCSVRLDELPRYCPNCGKAVSA